MRDAFRARPWILPCIIQQSNSISTLNFYSYNQSNLHSIRRIRRSQAPEHLLQCHSNIGFFLKVYSWILFESIQCHSNILLDSFSSPRRGLEPLLLGHLRSDLRISSSFLNQSIERTGTISLFLETTYENQIDSSVDSYMRDWEFLQRGKQGRRESSMKLMS